MAIAFDAFSHSIGTTSDAPSHAHTVAGSLPYLLAAVQTSCIFTNTPKTVTGVTYNSVAMTQLGTFYLDLASTSDDRRIYLFGLAGPTSGANTLAATLSGAPSSPSYALAAMSFAGVSQSSPVGTAVLAGAVSSSGSTNPSVTVTSAVDELVADFVVWGEAAATLGAGQTQRFQDNTTLSRAGSTEPGAASVSMDWDTPNTTHSWIQAGVSLKPGTIATNRRLLLGG